MLYEFRGFHNCESKCQLDFYAGPLGEVVVVATELPDNEGTSITNMAERLAGLVCEEWGINVERLLWIEHYPEGKSDSLDDASAESWDLVTFQIRGGHLHSPEWRALDPGELGILTATPLKAR